MKVNMVTTENVIKSIHTIKSFKECLQMHKLQKNREKVEGKVGPEVHAIIKGDLCRRTSDTL